MINTTALRTLCELRVTASNRWFVARQTADQEAEDAAQRDTDRASYGLADAAPQLLDENAALRERVAALKAAGEKVVEEWSKVTPYGLAPALDAFKALLRSDP